MAKKYYRNKKNHYKWDREDVQKAARHSKNKETRKRAKQAQQVKNKEDKYKAKVAPMTQGRKASAKTTQLNEKYIVNGKPQYTPQSIRDTFKNDTKAMKAEYTRLRSIAMKRMNRLTKNEIYKNSQMAVYYMTRMPGINQALGGNQQLTVGQMNKILGELLTDVNRFLSSPLSTIRGQTELRNERIMTLRSYGYDVTAANFQMVTDVLDYIRDTYQDLLYDSDQLVQEAVKLINEVINEPEFENIINSGDRGTRAERLGEEVYERYSSSSSDLWTLSDL